MTEATRSRTPERRDSDRQTLRRYYNTSEVYLQDLLEHDLVYHRPFAELMTAYVPRGARVLELGCGPGISTRMLDRMGYKPIGCDISPLFLRDGCTKAPELDWLAADALSLPFASASVDAVAGFEFVEHVTDVGLLLTECIRVLKPGGWLILHSPNLCSPFFPLQDILSLARGGPGRPVFAETLGAAIRWFGECLAVSLRKWLRARPEFLYRRPDPEEHVGGDADSAYLACQIDLARFLQRNHMIVHQVCHAQSATSRWIARLAPSWAPFIGLVAQRPQNGSK